VLRSIVFAGLPVVHGFSTRPGGVSPAPFDTLNFSFSNGDSPGNIGRNELILLEHAGLAGRSMATLDQVHGKSVVVIGDENPLTGSAVLGDGDALVTRRNDVVLGIKTADCTPVLLFDPENGVAASVHAGWRGTALRVAAEAVSVMSSEFGSRPRNIRAAIGPCIGACCYTVGDDVMRAFADTFGRGVHVTPPGAGPGGGARADLQGANASVLGSAGLEKGNIATIRLCTSCNRRLFFSHRRDGGVTGRHLNFIGRA
jgi:YfiH family protein